MRHRLIAWIIALAALAFSASPALAQDATKEAAAHFQRGVSLFSEADYGAALVEFKRAYTIAPNVNVLYNVGETQYQLQRYAEALTTFEQYVADGGQTHKAEVEQTIGVLKTRVGRVDVTTNAPGAEVQVDDETAGTTPLAKPITVSIGRRKVSAVIAGKPPVTKFVEVAAGETVPVRIELDTRPAGGASPEGARRSDKGSLATVGWITTAVLAVGTTVTGVLALNSAASLKNARDAFPADKSDLDGKASTTTALAITTDVLGVLTVGAAALSLYWTVSRPSSSVEVKAAVSPTGMKLVGSF